MNSTEIRVRIDGIQEIEYKIKSLKADLALLKNASNLECTYSANGQKVRIDFVSDTVNGAKLKDAVSSQLWQNIKSLERELSDKKALFQVAVDNFTKE
jgi:hypothetical protein